MVIAVESRWLERIRSATPSRLLDLWRRVIASTLEFSGTRLRNAEGWTPPAAELPAGGEASP